MPIPHNLDKHPPKALLANKPPLYDVSMRRESEESIRTEDYDGPLPDTLPEVSVRDEERDDTSPETGETLCTDRAELIERIKRGESPTWVPNQAVSGVQTSRMIFQWFLGVRLWGLV